MPDHYASSAYERRYAVLAAIMLGGIMGPIDGSIVNVILPTISDAFGSSIQAAQWVPLIYLLTISSLLLFFGRLGDIIGYRKVYLGGLASFVAASALCGLAPSLGWLVAFRALQGFAASMMMAVPFAVIAAVFPPEERGKALGINAISISAGLAIGPSLGGFLVSLAGWRLAFLINVPVGIAGVLWARRIIPELKGGRGRIDVPGMLTASASLLLLLYCVNRLQTSGLTPLLTALFVAGILSGAGFLLIEQRVKDPMVNLNLFRNAPYSFANLSALLNFMSQFVAVFLTPFYLQRVLHHAPEGVGLIMTSFPIAVMAVAPFAGSLSDRVGTSVLASAGTGLCAVALILLSRLSPQAAPLDVAWRLALFGLGTGVFQSPNNSAAMGSAPRQYLGVASGVLATMRNVGMALGIAAGGMVLYAFAPPDVLQRASLEGSAAGEFMSGLRWAYLLAALLAASASVLSLLRRRSRA